MPYMPYFGEMPSSLPIQSRLFGLQKVSLHYDLSRFPADNGDIQRGSKGQISKCLGNSCDKTISSFDVTGNLRACEKITKQIYPNMWWIIILPVTDKPLDDPSETKSHPIQTALVALTTCSPLKSNPIYHHQTIKHFIIGFHSFFFSCTTHPACNKTDW